MKIGLNTERCPTYIKLMLTKNQKVRIAIVEDNELYNHLLTTGLKNHLTSIPVNGILEVEICSYTNAKTALTEIDETFDIVFLDYYLGDSVTGLDILKKVKQLNPACKVIIVSQIKSSKTQEVLNEGADDFIYKDPVAIRTSCYKAANIIYQKFQFS